MAADAFLRYNPDEIEIVDQMSNVGGIQLRPGSVYESYPGNVVSNGVMRLTAFNRSGYYNGRGVLGSIVFRAKPGIKATTISFDYAPGRTTDSNVADVNSNDILNGAYGATYTFATGKCGGDATPPVVDGLKPAPGEIGYPLDGDISFNIKDGLAGVDIKTLKVQVNDTTYTPNGEPKLTYTGNPSKYDITINPARDFIPNAPIRVKINIQDLDGNAMAERVYSFNEFMPVGSCSVTVPAVSDLKPAACEPCAETLRPAAMEIRGISSWWPWWFVLLCSLILNLRLLTSRQRAKREKLPFAEGFSKHRMEIVPMPKKPKKKSRR
jgi:hypothetical protein